METRNYTKANGTVVEISISADHNIYVQHPLNCFTVYHDDVRPCIWQDPDTVPESWWESAVQRFVYDKEQPYLACVCTPEVWEYNFKWFKDHIHEICDSYGDAYVVVGLEHVMASFQSWDECILYIATLEHPEEYSVCESNTQHVIEYGYEDLQWGIFAIDTLTYQKYKDRVSKH